MQKPKTFRPWVPGQTSLLPASPSEWLSDDHQVYFLLDAGVPGSGVNPQGLSPA
ncbi:hypothetical protein I1E95_04215 [Synechococcus sp. CBW1107]|uniref:hypothetical protein n=1 Tax=Synechococcus sp. CBW1107 TaxID=2789857 RepID=UPI0018CE427F|nr:hypothetical protein [Synechococcus sp. CBW1107]QPN57338.1 hypothetical protein I1E95_04215 [Synechococcus sp. CBW1107]CAK6692950.1 hypothetical protein BBFGKLBO_01337 [Synechococcus sp. CBW1107]